MTDLHQSTAATDADGRSVRDTVLAVALAEPEQAAALWSSLDGILDLDTCWDTDVLRLLGAVHASLAADDHLDKPRDVARLRGVYWRNWYVAQRCRHDVDQLRTALHAAGIDSRVVGGVAWCDLAGIAPGERMVDDTTVVVSPRDLGSAAKIARALSWQTSGQGRENPSRFARPCVLRRPLDEARPHAGHTSLRLAVRAHVSAPVCRDGTIDSSLDDLAEQVLVAVLGGPTSPTDQGVEWKFDLVRFIRHSTADLRDVVQLAASWSVTAELRCRLADVMATHPSDRLTRLLETLDVPGCTSVAGSRCASGRAARLVAEWRSVARGDSWWSAVTSVPTFVAERLAVDSMRQIPGSVTRRLLAVERRHLVARVQRRRKEQAS